MVWVSRDGGGKISGAYANRQNGYAEEQLADGAPEVHEFFNPPAPPPFLVAPQIVAAALDMAVTPQNWDISNGSGMFNVVAAMYLDVGVYWMFFTEAQPDTNYFGIITGVSGATITDRAVDYFAIEVKDGAGSPVDASKLSVQIYRIST
jgi:hypothetical protein